MHKSFSLLALIIISVFSSCKKEPDHILWSVSPELWCVPDTPFQYNNGLGKVYSFPVADLKAAFESKGYNFLTRSIKTAQMNSFTVTNVSDNVNLFNTGYDVHIKTEKTGGLGMPVAYGNATDTLGTSLALQVTHNEIKYYVNDTYFQILLRFYNSSTGNNAFCIQAQNVVFDFSVDPSAKK